MKSLRESDSGASAIVGSMLMLVLCVSMIPGLIALKSAVSDEADAQADLSAAHAEQSRRAAWCARHPEIGPPECSFMDDFECREIERLIVCTKRTIEHEQTEEREARELEGREERE